MSDLGGKSDRKNTPFCQRLDYTVTVVAGGQAKLVKKLENQIPLSSLNRYLDGYEIPSHRAGLIAEATGVSLDWLILGRGSPRFGKNSAEPPKFENSDVVLIPSLDGGATAVPDPVAEAAAVNDQIAFSRSCLHQLGMPPERVAFLRAIGESMAPTIRDGGLVLVDRGGHEIIRGKIYVVSFGDELRIARLVRSIDSRITLKFDGDERLFPPETLGIADAEQLQVHGRVFWTEKVL